MFLSPFYLKKPFLPFYFTKPNTFDNLLEFDCVSVQVKVTFTKMVTKARLGPILHMTKLYSKHFNVQFNSKPNHDKD